MENTWEPIENLNYSDLLKEFQRRYPNRARKARRLAEIKN